MSGARRSSVVVLEDMDIDRIEDMAIGFQPYAALGFATMLGRENMVGGMPMRHDSFLLPTWGGPSRAGEGLMGLGHTICQSIILQLLVRPKHDAGESEETNRMIPEEARSCHSIEKTRKIDGMLPRTEATRMRMLCATTQNPETVQPRSNGPTCPH